MDELEKLYKAVCRFAHSHGGKILVIGGVEVQDWKEGKYNFRIAINCLGRRPKCTPETRLLAAKNPRLK